MRLDLGSPVRCADERFGKLADVVIDPRKRRITHLVVKPRQRFSPARLVPIELVQAQDDAISLRCTLEEASGLEPVQTTAYLRWGESEVNDPDWDVGIETVLAPPHTEYSGLGSPLYSSPLDPDPHISILYDRIPKGEVEIRRASPVFSADGERLGHVEGFLLDGDDALTHIVLEHGHLLGRRDVTIPIRAVALVETDSVRLGLTKDQAEGLPAVRVRR